MMGRIIDLHCHPLLPMIVEGIDKAEVGSMQLPPWSVELQTEVMDQHGIETAMLSVNSIAESMVGRPGQAKARAINEALAALVAQHPARFGAFATVPMDDMDAANEETAYALDVLHLDGVGIVTQCQGRYLGEPHYDPWLAEMDRRGATLYVHPAAPPGYDGAQNRTNLSVLEFMFESTRMVTTMVLSGSKSRFGKINLISTHAGGTVPFLAKRISLAGSMPWAYRDGPKLGAEQIFAALASFYFDLTAATASTVLDAVKDLVPADRLLMGFDYPLMPPQTIAPAIAQFDAYQGFTDDEKSAISRGNAMRLFPRLAKLSPATV